MFVVWIIALVVGRGAANIVIKAWGDDGEILPLRTVIDDDFIGGSGLEDKDETKMDKVLEDCLGKCRVTEVGLMEKRPCSDGCNSQATVLEELKAKFPQTPLQYLLGTAVDKCWEGCGMYEELDAKEGVSDKDKCKIGCTSMQKLQRKSYKDIEVPAEKSKESSEQSKEPSKESKESSNESKESSEEIMKELLTPDEHVKFGSDIFKDDMTVEDLLPNVFDRKENEDIDDSQFGGWHIYVIRPWSDVNSQMEEVRKQLMGWFNGEIESQDQDSESSLSSLRSSGETAPQWLYRSPELRPSPSFSSQASSAFTDLKQGAKTTFTDLKNGASATMSQLGRGANAAFSNFKAEVGAALAGNSLTTNLFWILIGSGMVVLLASFFSWIYDIFFPNKNQDDGDYYKLKGGASPPVLPSYADCVKADKASLRDVGEFEEYFKVNLGYPRPMVVNISEEKVPLERNQEL